MKVNSVKWINLIIILAFLFIYEETANNYGDISKSFDAYNDKNYAYENEDTSGSMDTWQDGTYEGEAEGFGGIIRVSVDILNGRISEVSIMSSDGETPEYMNNARRLLQEICEKQTTHIDVVSGATFSSNGILNAVKNALDNALKDK